MSNVILYYHGENEEKEAILNLYKEQFPSLNFFMVDKSIKVFKTMKKHKPLFVVFYWNTHPSPTFFIEEYFKNKMTHMPLFLLYKTVENGHFIFFNEYNIKDESVCVARYDLKSEYYRVFELMKGWMEKKDPKIILRHFELLFFAFLKNKKQQEALKVLQVLLKKAMPMEQFFYRGIFLKEKGNAEEAVNVFIKALEKGSAVKLFHCLGNAFYKVKDYNNALQYLGQAYQKSPFNTNRIHIMHKCQDKSGQTERALQMLKNIKSVCPAYKRIDMKVLEYCYKKAKAADDLKDMIDYVGNVEARDLIKLYKKTKVDNDEVKRYLLDLLIREFSLRANNDIKENDFGGALKFYRHIEQIIDKSDKKKYVNFLYCVSRAYFKLEKYDNAKSSNHEALVLSDGAHEKSKNLALLIKKAEQRKELLKKKAAIEKAKKKKEQSAKGAATKTPVKKVVKKVKPSA